MRTRACPSASRGLYDSTADGGVYGAVLGQWSLSSFCFVTRMKEWWAGIARHKSHHASIFRSTTDDLILVEKKKRKQRTFLTGACQRQMIYRCQRVNTVRRRREGPRSHTARSKLRCAENV